MKADRFFLKIYGEKSEGQWSLICLDFSLASQAPSLDEAKSKLEEQIKEYIYDAMVGQDKQHAHRLLSRRAPLKYWLKWYLSLARTRLVGHANKHEEAFCEPMQLVPA
jgi:hypothetical protein